MAIFLLDGNNGPDFFQETVSSVNFDLNAFATPQRSLVATRINTMLNDRQREALLKFANWEQLFPVQSPSTGRSLYAHTKDDAEFPVRGVKMKGAGGLRREEDRWLCYPPKPRAHYGQATQFHVSLDQNLHLTTIAGRPKALNSLRADSAENEFDLQEKLASADVGFRGLLAGRFDTIEGGEERNLHGDATGAVMIEYDPDFELTGNFLKFCAIQGEQSTEVVHSEIGHIPEGERSLHPYVENYIAFAGGMARAKHQATIIAGVGRHAGHYDNFLYNPRLDKMLVTDVDSSLALESLDDAERGAQLLRDMGNDMVRMISTLSYFSYTDTFLRGLEDSTHKPFESFLCGYLGDSIQQDEIVREAAMLQGQYLAYVQAKKQRLDWISDSMRQAVITGNFPVPEQMMASNWSAAHIAFTAECLTSCYALLRKSNLMKRGFSLPKMERSAVAAQCKSGISEHCSVLQAESDRVTNGRGPLMY